MLMKQIDRAGLIGPPEGGNLILDQTHLRADRAKSVQVKGQHHRPGMVCPLTGGMLFLRIALDAQIEYIDPVAMTYR